MSNSFRANLSDLNLGNPLEGTLYRGTIVDTDDPLYRGRARIRIFGIHTQQIKKTVTEGIPDKELPWAEQVAPCIGGTSGNGFFAVPTLGTIVWCFFDGGDHLHPVYFGAQFGATVIVDGTGALPANNPALPATSTPAQEGSQENATSEEQKATNAQYDGGGIRLLPDGRIDPASIDTSCIKFDNSRVDLTGLDPRVAEDLVNLSKDYKAITGEKLPISEAWRDYSEQQRLFKVYGAGRAATPGKSNHGFGRAVDIKASAVPGIEAKLKSKGTSLTELLNKNHFGRPLLNAKTPENWHLESTTVANTAAMQYDRSHLSSGKKPGSAYITDSAVLAKYGGTMVAEK